MKKQLVTIISIALLLLSATIVAETNHTIDTARNPKHLIENITWNVKMTNGIQRSYFFEIGISRCFTFANNHGMVGSSISISYRNYPDFKGDNSVHSFHTEAAIYASGGLGLELGYYTSNGIKDFMIVPKFYFGVSNVNIHYGYAFSTNHYPFSRIGKHQFGLTINLPFYWNDKLRKKKSWGLDIYGKKR